MNKLVSGLVIFLVVLIAGWFAFNQRHLVFNALFSEKSSQDTRQTSAASVKKKPVHPEKIKTRAKNVNTSAQSYAPASGKQIDKNIAQNMPTSSGDLKSRPGVPVQKNLTRPRAIKKPTPAKRKIPIKNTAKRTQPLQPTGSRRTPESSPAKQRSTRTPTPEKASAGQDTRFDALSAINDSRLKLQAIAWSDDITRRMAVINNHIVREGETVDGFSITSIRSDDVIVNDGTSSWRLEFSLKQR